jgi:hypothetical protein
MIFRRVTNALMLTLILLIVFMSTIKLSNLVYFLIWNSLLSIIGIIILNYIVLGRFVIFHIKKITNIDSESIEFPKFIKPVIYIYIAFLMIACLYFVISPMQNCISILGSLRGCIDRHNW